MLDCWTLGVGFTIHDSRFTIHDSRSTIHGSRFLARDLRSAVGRIRRGEPPTSDLSCRAVALAEGGTSDICHPSSDSRSEKSPYKYIGHGLTRVRASR
jgi:hypothetical protein